MTNRTTVSLLFSAAALAFAFAGQSARAEDKITLRVGDSFPPTHYVVGFMKQWMAQVTEATKGKVAFEHYGSEQLGKAKDMLALTQSGVSDISYVAPSYVSEKMPLSAVAELPGGFDSSCTGTHAYWRLARGNGILAKREFEPNGVRLLFTVLGAPYQITTRQEISTIDSIAGLKLRSYGGHQDTAVKALKAVPIRMAAPEMYESMSRGTIDGFMLPLASVLSYNLQGLVRYATGDLNFGSVAFNYIISEAKFKKLPADVQQAMLQVGDRVIAEACRKIDEDTTIAIGKLKDAGVTIVKLAPEERQRVNDLLKDIAPNWASELDRRGKPGTQVLKAFREALAAAN